MTGARSTGRLPLYVLGAALLVCVWAVGMLARAIASGEASSIIVAAILTLMALITASLASMGVRGTLRRRQAARDDEGEGR